MLLTYERTDVRVKAVSFALSWLTAAVIFFAGGVKVYALDSPEPGHSGWEYSGDGVYFTGNDGAAVTGWRVIEDERYVFHSDGRLVTGWALVDGGLRYFGDDGVMRTGWQEINGRKYYFNSYGVMLTGEYTVYGRDYYFGQDGALTVTSEYYGGNAQKFTRGMGFGTDDQLAAVKGMEFEIADYDEGNVWFVPCDDAVGVYTFDEQGILDGCTLVYSGNVPGSAEAGLFFTECGWIFSEADSIVYDTETYVYISPDGRLVGRVRENGMVMEIKLIVNS